MQTVRPGLRENQIEAELLYIFRSHNALAAYEPTVASGANACTLHYRGNQSLLQANDLLLVDAGCEVDCYASDITRTIPISGRFTAAQRELYEVVLSAQNAAISKSVAGNAWRDIHDASLREIVRGLLDLKLLTGKLDSAIKNERYKQYFPHKTGHWLGLDVHDVGEYQIEGSSRVLEAGMVLTVEPGIYIEANDTKAAKSLRGQAVRIEDEVVITDAGPMLLTAGVPRGTHEIEALMQASHSQMPLAKANEQ
jgi:Xaa-Pro aminopeptidase